MLCFCRAEQRAPAQRVAPQGASLRRCSKQRRRMAAAHSRGGRRAARAARADTRLRVRTPRKRTQNTRENEHAP
jgi:hypothetical protein